MAESEDATPAMQQGIQPARSVSRFISISEGLATWLSANSET